jgi:hypothetical protein
MAGNFGTLSSSSINTGTVVKTLVQLIAPANQGVRVGRLSVSFGGTSPTASKALVEVVKGATGGTSSALTLQKSHGIASGIQATAKENFTVEPSGGTVLAAEEVHPQSGITFNEEWLLSGGENISVRVTLAAGVTSHARMRFEE